MSFHAVIVMESAMSNFFSYFGNDIYTVDPRTVGPTIRFEYSNLNPSFQAIAYKHYFTWSLKQYYTIFLKT